MVKTDATITSPIGMITGDDLIKEARRRRTIKEFRSIPKGSPLPKGWRIHKEFKTKIRLVREKDVETQLRDKIWLLFYEMGIPLISARDFALQLKKEEGIKPFQPAVVAQDDGIVFVAVTASQGLPARKKRMDREIEELAQDQDVIRIAIRKALGVSKAKFVFVIATENIIWREEDLYAAKDANILVWDEYDILALQELVKIAGEGARYQVYNRIFYRKRIKGFDVRVPALRARMGGRTYYCMVMTPEHLLKIAYVHQRSASSSLVDISDTYQRVLNHRRVQEIRKYIEGGGFFPNSVILNFTRPFRKVERIGTQRQLDGIAFAEPVMVTLPPYFGSAWIIDGQHRIYGYADSELKKRETIPVVAFVEESTEDQARMFLDINEKQKAIRSDLRWDLYEDIYLEATNPREQELYAISVIAKRLNELSPLNGSVKIPSKGNRGHISLTTLCRVIKSQRFIEPEKGPLNCGSVQESIEFAAQRIARFFQVIADWMPDEWRAGPDHYIHTNAGIVVLLGILRDFLDAMHPDEIQDIERFEQVIARFLSPLIRYLREAPPETIDNYRSAGGATGASRQVQASLTRLIVAADVGFKSHFLQEYEEERARERERRMMLEEGHIILLAGEGETLEVKGSLSLDINRLLLGDGRREKSDEATKEILSTIVGFLNSKRGGGRLVIGAIETKRYDKDRIKEVFGDCPQVGEYTVIGVKNDYQYRDWDQYELQLRDLIKAHISPDIEPSIELEPVLVEGRTLAVIKVTRDLNQWHYLDNEHFYVRSGNRTILLTGREMDAYKRRWEGRTA